jgi:hypothetical protein
MPNQELLSSGGRTRMVAYWAGIAFIGAIPALQGKTIGRKDDQDSLMNSF